MDTPRIFTLEHSFDVQTFKAELPTILQKMETQALQYDQMASEIAGRREHFTDMAKQERENIEFLRDTPAEELIDFVTRLYQRGKVMLKNIEALASEHKESDPEYYEMLVGYLLGKEFPKFTFYYPIMMRFWDEKIVEFMVAGAMYGYTKER